MKYRGPKPFEFSYPAGWTLQEDENAVSLWKTSKGGAVTISSVVNKDSNIRGNALEHCRRFAEKHAFDPPRLSGDSEAADAAFTDQDGAWCKARFMASGNRMVLATYNASIEDQLEEVEADGILASPRIVPVPG